MWWNQHVILIYFLLAGLQLVSCRPQFSRMLATSSEIVQVVQLTSNSSCGDFQSYIQHGESDLAPRVIRLNFHFMNSQSGAMNYTSEEATVFAHELLKAANAAIESNQKMWLPPGNDTPVLPIGYRYVITSSAGYKSERGIYCHHDDERYFFVSRGRNKNNYDRSVIRKYGIGLDSILNVFVMPHHPDSILSPSYDLTSAGIALGSAIKLSGVYESGKKPSEFRGLLNHEIGHVLGLRHTWSGNDGCDDTPTHPNCWNRTSDPPCDSMASNNLMDYNANQHAWTPCQIGRIHQNMSNENSLARRLLVPTWCKLEGEKTLEIRDSTVWNGSLDLNSNLVVSSGATLRIRCRVSMPAGSSIVVEPDGHLILEEATLHNACGLQWDGIYLSSRGKSKGRLTLIGNNLISETEW